jgi:hypothetical protein
LFDKEKVVPEIDFGKPPSHLNPKLGAYLPLHFFYGTRQTTAIHHHPHPGLAISIGSFLH